MSEPGLARLADITRRHADQAALRLADGQREVHILARHRGSSIIVRPFATVFRTPSTPSSSASIRRRLQSLPRAPAG